MSWTIRPRLGLALLCQEGFRRDFSTIIPIGEKDAPALSADSKARDGVGRVELVAGEKNNSSCWVTWSETGKQLTRPPAGPAIGSSG